MGANILGELGWAAQDLINNLLDGDLRASDRLMQLVSEVIANLPQLVESYKTESGLDIDKTRELTNRCFRIVSAGEEDLAEDMPTLESSVVPIRTAADTAPATDSPGQ